jgi:tRNA pseudouridine55 synthase
LTGLDKVYEGIMLLGTVTDSYDLDGAVVEERPVPELDDADIQGALDRFVGDILQTPPMVSAVKVNGERLYKKARKGQVVEREPRPVTVHEFTLTHYESPHAAFRLRCTRGTYARSLVHDAGALLGCGATLAELRRTAVGPHPVEQARPVDAFEQPDDVAGRLIPLGEALTLPEIVVDGEAERIVLSGGTLDRRFFRGECPAEEGWIQVKARSGDLLALAEVEPSPLGYCIRPRRVLRG